MRDGKKKGNGRSRYMKAAIDSSLSWEAFRAMLIAGTLPFDMSLNMSTGSDAGWDEQGTLLSKGNMLAEDAAEATGFNDTADNPTVSMAIYRLAALIASANNLLSLDNIEIEASSVSGSGWVDYMFVKAFSGVPLVLAWNSTSLVEVTNITDTTMQLVAPANFIAIYDGGV